MSLSESEVRNVAKLARISLGDDEVAPLTSELNAIVSYVEQLAEVDTSGVEPIANVAELVNVTRADEPGPLLPVDAVLANAARANDRAILVPKAVER